MAEAARPDDQKPERRRGKTALELMQAEEQKLFGGGDSGQGMFLLKVEERGVNSVNSNIRGDSLSYIAIGLLRHNGEIENNRSYFPSGCFLVNFFLKPTITRKQTAQLESAIKIFGLLGGLGARARRGWGSVSLTEWNGEDCRTENYSETVQALLKKPALTWQQLPFTALSKDMRIRVCSNKPNSLEALSFLAKNLQKYRSYLFTRKQFQIRPRLVQGCYA